MNRRILKLIMDNDKMGFWHAECKECPLLEALKTLNQKPRACVSGLITNMQGPVVVGKCEYYAGDTTVQNEPFSIGCNKD